MSDITHKDIDQLGDRIEKKIDKRFDTFETHFDETMGAIRLTLDEISDQTRAERRREMTSLRDAL